MLSIGKTNIKNKFQEHKLTNSSGLLINKIKNKNRVLVNKINNFHKSRGDYYSLVE